MRDKIEVSTNKDQKTIDDKFLQVCRIYDRLHERGFKRALPYRNIFTAQMYIYDTTDHDGSFSQHYIDYNCKVIKQMRNRGF